MRWDWIPLSASALVVGAMALAFAVVLNPVSPDGDAVVLRNDHGAYHGHVQIVPIARRNLQVHWPEGNVLLDHRRRSAESGVPDYNAHVRVERDEPAARAAD